MVLLPVPEKLDDIGGRAIVIEDVPPGTGMTDLVGAFSAFGTIRLASLGPPAVVAFETEASAAQALLVASMKSVRLLGAFRDMKLAPPMRPLPEVEIGSNEATAAPPAEDAAPETKTSHKEDVKVIVDELKMLSAQMKDQISRIRSDLLAQNKKIQSDLERQMKDRSSSSRQTETLNVAA